jgi:hypothetical protein
LRKKGLLAKAAQAVLQPKGTRVRVRSKAVEVVGGTRITNRTANSIEVEVADDGTVTVTDCCLEEQHK